MKLIVKNLQKKIPISQKKIKKLILRALQIEKIKKNGQLSLFLVTDRKIRALNNIYCNRNRATDVLSFDLALSDKQLFADIFISVDTAKRNSKHFKTSTQREIELYAVHGLLHLIGYGDSGIKEKQRMFKRQESIIKAIDQSA